MKRTPKSHDFVICISNRGFRASLIPRRIYETVSDAAAKKRGLLRVIDESGEDYLFPESLFIAIALTEPVARAVAKAG
ncbi:MAG: hypothetical protein U0625_07145 [Phycisphaerales bacterium]